MSLLRKLNLPLNPLKGTFANYSLGTPPLWGWGVNQLNSEIFTFQSRLINYS